MHSSDGLPLARIGQGSWDLPESGARCDEAISALRAGVEAGLTHIDTAEMYGSGRVETLIGAAIAPLDRSRLFLTSKVLPSNASFDGTLAACERSLTRLGTSYLDLYLLHWPSETPFAETARALRRLRDEGLVRYVGVSNFDIAEFEEAYNLLDGLACNQVLYHLGERGMEHRVLPFARQHGIAVVGYTPFGRGSYRRSGSDVLEAIAQRHGRTVSQVILAFLTRESQVYAIPKAARRVHMLENAGAIDLRLTAEDIAGIESTYPRGNDGPLATL